MSPKHWVFTKLCTQVPFSACFTAFQSSTTAHLITRRMGDVRRVLRWYRPASTLARRSSASTQTVDWNDSASHVSHAFTRIRWCTDRWFFSEFVNNFCRLNLYHCGMAFVMDASKQSSCISIHLVSQAFVAWTVVRRLQFSSSFFFVIQQENYHLLEKLLQSW